MDEGGSGEALPLKNDTAVERKSERELVVRRTINAPAHLVFEAWTNDEGDGGQTVTTVTFEESDGQTLVVLHDLYPSEEALASGSTGAMPEALGQLDELVTDLASSKATA